jgi:hypothetical protein
VAEFDKVVPPGGEGKITLKVDTRGYRGEVSKNARVYSNDPKNPVSTLSLKVFVKVPILVSARYVRLEGLPGEKDTKTVEIKAQKEKALTLEAVGLSLGRNYTRKRIQGEFHQYVPGGGDLSRLSEAENQLS